MSERPERPEREKLSGQARYRNGKRRHSPYSKNQSGTTSLGSGTDVPVLYPGSPELMTRRFERLAAAVASNFKFHKDLVRDYEYQEPPELTITAQERADMENDLLLRKQLEVRVTNHEKKLEEWRDTKREIFDYIWLHLSERSRNWVIRRNDGNYPDTMDPLGLITDIHYTHSFKTFTGVQMSDAYDAMDRFRELKQTSKESVFEFRQRFESAIVSITSAQLTIPSDQELAVEFARKLDERRYGQLVADIFNGIVAMPATYIEVSELAERRHVYHGGKVINPGAGRFASAAFHTAEQDDKKKGNKKDQRKKDDEEGHGCRSCPKREAVKTAIQNKALVATATTAEHDADSGESGDENDGSPYHGYVIRRADECNDDEDYPDFDNAGEGKFEVLLDNQATNHLIRDRELLYDIRDLDSPVRFNGIGGETLVTKCGTMPYFGHVFYHPKAPVNILSFGIVENEYDVTYEKLSRMTVHVTREVDVSFWRIDNGMYVANMEALIKRAKRRTGSAYVSTVEQREALYDNRQVERAKRAREFIRRAGFPSLRDAVDMIKSGMVLDADITVQDLYRANAIYGNEVAVVKGKSKERKARSVPERYEISKHVGVQAEQIMFADLAYIEGLTFLVTITAPLGLWMVSHIDDKTSRTLKNELTRAFDTYQAKGFKVAKLVTDSEEVFMSIKSVVEQRGVAFDPSGPNKHVHKIEVSIRVLKERVRSVIYSLPYVLPRKLIPTLVVFVTARLNAMPCKTRVDPTPPREIFTNMKTSLKREFRIGFGEVVLVENVPNKKNSMEPRAREALALCPSTSVSGGYHFFLLDTEEFVVRTNWVENVPLTKALIDRINQIAARDEQLMVHNAEKGLGKKLAKLSYKPTPWSGSMEVKHGEALAVDVEDMSPKIIDRKSIPQMQVDDETAKTKRPAVQRVEELSMEQDQHDEEPDHRGADVPDHRADQSNCRGADPHVEPVVEPDAPAENFPVDTAAVDNDSDTSADEEANLGRERGILPASALGIHADGLEDAASEDGDELAVPTQDAEAQLPPPEPPPDSGGRSTRFRGQKHVRVYVNAEKTNHAFHIGLRRALKLHGDSAKQAVQSELKQMEEKEVWSPVFRQDLVHSFLGMNFDFSSCRRAVKVTMTGFTEDLLKSFPTKGTAMTPANADLFKSSSDAKPLSAGAAKEFHSCVAKLLYLCKRVRPDMLTAVSYLTTRVKCPTDEDLEKLTRVLKYLNATRGLGIVLERTSKAPIAYIDASFGVHDDYKSHSGLIVTLGKGPLIVSSSKQRLNTKSSTEAELVAMSDKLGDVIWLSTLLAEQERYKGSETHGDDGTTVAKVYQDNKSAIRLAELGKAASANTRHINLRFFFVKDKIDSGEVKVEYLKTTDMVADILTKPIQGALFRHLRQELMNHEFEGASAGDCGTTGDNQNDGDF
eukprot:gene16756-11987_t